MAFKKKNHKCKKEIGFIWIDEDFFNYSFEEERIIPIHYQFLKWKNRVLILM